MNPFIAFFATLFSMSSQQQPMNIESVYDISINTLNGKSINLSDFKGKYILFVNVASKCGFTSQYKELQKLHENFKNKLQIIGLPCNQFGNQEPGNAKDILTFCEVNYGVKFLITEKIDVKGKNQHPLYTWLSKKVNNGITDSSVKWNFQKYLISPDGNLIDYFLSATSPLNKKIVKHLK